MPFFVRQKVQISSEMLPQIPNFASFSSSENEALSAAYNSYCCWLILWNLAKTVRGFWLLLFSRKKQVTAEYWASFGSKGVCRQKCDFSLVKKCKFLSKILPQIPNFVMLQCTSSADLLTFVKFRQKSVFSSRRPVFVISSFFVRNEILWILVIVISLRFFVLLSLP